MMQDETFEICPTYRREDFDFDKIQLDKNTPITPNGEPLYPLKMHATHGSSFTYKVSNEWFFKRKLQDGRSPQKIFSQHHYNQAYNELYGTFDDLGEVIAYHLAQSIIDPHTGKPILDVPEYKLATYLDEHQILYRGCASKNVCTRPTQRLRPMTYLVKDAGLTGNSIDVYMKALEKYVAKKGAVCDFDLARRTLVKNSAFSWKIANSDNHNNNILILVEDLPSGQTSATICPMIDNGSAYELSVRYKNDEDKLRLDSLYSDDHFSREDENGNRNLLFSYYPYMHTAFHLENDKLLIDDTSIAGKNYAYEYCLASEMLADKELYREVYEIEKQLNPQNAIDKVNELYGKSLKGSSRKIQWPPHLIEFMFATNELKSKVLSYVVADYYLKVAFESCISDKNPQLLAELSKEFLNTPLQASKEIYDNNFIALASHYGVKIDKSKLEQLNFKKGDQMAKSIPEANE